MSKASNVTPIRRADDGGPDHVSIPKLQADLIASMLQDPMVRALLGRGPCDVAIGWLTGSKQQVSLHHPSIGGA